MDGMRFDGWTRRRFGVAAGGMAAALLGIAGIGDTDATRKGRAKGQKHKKRCRKATHTCGGKHQCCGDLRCEQEPVKFGGDRQYCCKREGKPCSGESELECCSGFTCAEGFCASLPPEM